MKKEGFNTTYREIPGRHYWFLWRDFLAQYAPDRIPAAGEIVNLAGSASPGCPTSRRIGANNLAAYLPARRAARVDQMVALR